MDVLVKSPTKRNSDGLPVGDPMERLYKLRRMLREDAKRTELSNMRAMSLIGEALEKKAASDAYQARIKSNKELVEIESEMDALTRKIDELNGRVSHLSSESGASIDRDDDEYISLGLRIEMNEAFVECRELRRKHFEKYQRSVEIRQALRVGDA